MDDFFCEQDYRPLIPDGFYTAQCISYNYGFIVGGKAKKLFLHFKILSEGKFFGIEIFRAYNMPKDGKIKLGSDYYKAYCLAYGWNKPSRRDRMSPKIFKNKIFKIKTRKATPKYGNKEMPENFKYSVVDYIADVVTGPIP